MIETHVCTILAIVSEYAEVYFNILQIHDESNVPWYAKK